MEYKPLLKMLTVFGQGTKFDTKGVSDALISAQFFPAKPPHHSLLPKLYSPKRISGDLDRLYKMGFLSRERRPRLVSDKASTCFRGFKYDYEISKQGWQYLEYLEKVREDPVSDAADRAFRAYNTDQMYKMLPESLAEELERIVYTQHYTDRGRHNRFPRLQRDKLLLSLEICQGKVLRKQAEIDRLREIVSRSGLEPLKQ